VFFSLFWDGFVGRFLPGIRKPSHKTVPEEAEKQGISGNCGTVGTVGTVSPTDKRPSGNRESTMSIAQTEHRLPFGRHKNKALAEVPSDYLRWAIHECKLSSGLRLAVAEELTRRGIEVPPPPPPPTIPKCHRCGDAGYSCRWQADAAGRKQIRASCHCCGGFLTFPPCIPPFTTEANRTASPAPSGSGCQGTAGQGIPHAGD
jgi:uncharacterized protein (DUF3820 family)